MMTLLAAIAMNDIHCDATPYAEYLNNLFLISLSNTINDFGVFDIWRSDGKLEVKQMRKTALTNCDKVVRFDSNFEVNREGVVECEGGG